MAEIKMPTTQIKVLDDGQVMICTPVVPNFKGELSEPRPIKFQVHHLIRAVRNRMEHCIGQLLNAQKEGQITCVITREKGTEIHFACGEAFHSGSYSAMESLLTKLEANRGLEEGLDVLQLFELLTVQEADQLFKSWIQSGHSWDSKAALLDYLRDDLRRQQQA